MKLEGSNVLVTGGAGFIGSHLVEELVRKKAKVTIFDNFDRGRREHLEWALKHGEVTVIEGDVRDRASLRKACEKKDVVFHEAAICINKCVAFPEECAQTNIDGTLNTILSAKEAGVKKFVFASSASVYGNPTYVPMDENYPFNPITPYCVSKIAGEYFLRIYGKELPYVILRYFNVFGPRQPTDAYYTSVIMAFVKKILAGERPVINGDGTQTMDFVHVKDIVQANILAAEKNVSGEAFNVAGGKETSIKEVVEIIGRITHSEVKPEYRGETNVIVKRRLASIEKISKELGYRPTVSVIDGLREIVEDVKADQKKANAR